MPDDARHEERRYPSFYSSPGFFPRYPLAVSSARGVAPRSDCSDYEDSGLPRIYTHRNIGTSTRLRSERLGWISYQYVAADTSRQVCRSKIKITSKGFSSAINISRESTAFVWFSNVRVETRSFQQYSYRVSVWPHCAATGMELRNPTIISRVGLSARLKGRFPSKVWRV